MTWTREHDALIARVAEGAEIRTCDEAMNAHRVTSPGARKHYRETGGNHWYVTPDGESMPVSNYNTDIVACLRAAEAWRKQEPRIRAYEIESPRSEGGAFTGVASSAPDFNLEEAGATAAEALAAALYFACGGKP
jgi:hypothetical protein